MADLLHMYLPFCPVDGGIANYYTEFTRWENTHKTEKKRRVVPEEESEYSSKCLCSAVYSIKEKQIPLALREPTTLRDARCILTIQINDLDKDLQEKLEKYNDSEKQFAELMNYDLFKMFKPFKIKII